jgi:hypothetical protein
MNFGCLFADLVLRPVLMAVSRLPIPVQQSIGATVLRLLCEAWLDYIYMHRIKFRYAYHSDKQAEGRKPLHQEVSFQTMK